MIPSSLFVKTGAALVSIAVLAAGLVMGVHDDPVKIEGGGQGASARLGASFVDLSKGTQAADPIEETQPSDPVTPTPPNTVSPNESSPAERARPQAVAPVAPPAPANSADVLPPDAPVVAVQPEASSAEPTAPVQMAKVKPFEPIAAEAPKKTVSGEAPEPGVVATSPRPQRRTAEFEARVRSTTPPPSQPEPRVQPQGNAALNAQASSQTSSRDRSASPGAGQPAARSAGNAAASNYPGHVMQQLSRVRRPRIRARGSATVAFSIAASGGLASAQIARSSGSPALDRAAVQLVQRAAPFPAPPPGAQRTFSINIAGQ
ncbi:hypothetical protein JSE7799_02009 [Jannaschia seosinensis]|uniref:TonB C-terminal domain-containing protein n=1 Tax=Jannaschia seosinensis TaxID=313367 RepID=A0A0M7BD64_9RHOB|nr:hypothetical protein JSE7799_02009 [Jannaschia seosinensis]